MPVPEGQMAIARRFIGGMTMSISRCFPARFAALWEAKRAGWGVPDASCPRTQVRGYSHAAPPGHMSVCLKPELT